MRKHASLRNSAHDKKGDDILVLEVGPIMGIVEYFVVTSASNTRQVRTIVDEIEKQMRERADVKPRSTEGLTDASWVLVDYGDFVVHVFLSETREFYGLERLWSDAPRRRLARRTRFVAGPFGPAVSLRTHNRLDQA